MSNDDMDPGTVPNDNKRTETLLTRRNALLGSGGLTAGALLSGTGLSIADGIVRQVDPEPPDGGESDDSIPDSRKNIWTAKHREYITDKPKTRRQRRYVISSNTTLQYVGAQWTKFGNPVSDQDISGAWQYTFKLDSTAVALVPKELEKGYRGIDDAPGAFSASDLNKWPAARNTDWVPASTVAPGRRYPYPENIPETRARAATRLADRVSTIKIGDLMAVRSVGSNATNVAVSARRDADLFGILSSTGARKFYVTNQSLANSYASFDPSSVAVANVAQLKAKIKEVQENRAALLKLITLALGQTSKVYNKAIAPIRDLKEALDAFNELLDSADLDPLEGFEGFKQVRKPRGSATGHQLVFDVYVAPNRSGACLVQSDHPVDIGFQEGDLDEPVPEDAKDIKTDWVLEFEATSEPGDPDDPVITPSPPSIVQTLEADEEERSDNDSDPDIYKTNLQPAPNGASPAPGINVVDGEYRAGDTIPMDAYDTARAGAALDTYEWTVERATTTEDGLMIYEDTNYSGNSPVFKPTIEQPGQYRITLKVTDTTTQVGRTSTDVYVAPRRKPNPEITADPTFIAPGGEVTFSASNNGNVAVDSWTWVLPPGPFEGPYELPSSPDGTDNLRSGSEITERFPYPSAGRKYDIKLIAEGVNGERASAVYELAVEPEPYLNIWPESENKNTSAVTLQPGETVTPFWEYPPTFEVSGQAWLSGGIIKRGIEPPPEFDSDVVEPVTVEFEEPGEYQVLLRLSDSTGVSAIDTIDVTVENETSNANVVDDFEDGDIDEYVGDSKEQFAVREDRERALSGDYLLFSTNDTQYDAHGIASLPNDGLDTYPSRGDSFSCYVYHETGNVNSGIFFGAQDTNFVEGVGNKSTPDSTYQVGYDIGENRYLLRREQDDSVEILDTFSENQGAIYNQWLEYAVDWGDPITFTVYEVDTNRNRTRTVGSASASDQTYSEGGVGFLVNDSGPEGTNVEIWYDYFYTRMS